LVIGYLLFVIELDGSKLRNRSTSLKLWRFRRLGRAIVYPASVFKLNSVYIEIFSSVEKGNAKLRY
jgi:hypothetical protein